MLNHLWQSTWFAVAAGILTLLFRRNRAPVRFWIWFSASCKFLAPFALLAGIGSLMPAPRIHRPSQQPIAYAVIQTAELISEGRHAPLLMGQILLDRVIFAVLGVWSMGFFAVAIFRLRGWLRIRAAVRASQPMDLVSPVNGCSLRSRAARTRRGRIMAADPAPTRGHLRTPHSAPIGCCSRA